MKTWKRIALVLLTLMIGMVFIGPAFGEDAGAAKVDINKASAEELTQLNKIGPKYAQRIVHYRETNGPFQHAEDIMNVKGIGPKTWEANKNRITVSSKSLQASAKEVKKQ